MGRLTGADLQPVSEFTTGADLRRARIMPLFLDGVPVADTPMAGPLIEDRPIDRVPTPPPLTVGKGSVQRELPPVVGQHNLLDRLVLGIGTSMADSYQALGRWPTSWGDALQNWMTVMPGGGLLGATRIQWTPEMQAMARQMHTAGYAMQDTADRVGVSTEALRRHLVEDQGLPIPPRGGRPTELPLDDLRALHEQGLSLPDIASRYGVGARLVASRLQELGIDTRRFWGTPRQADIVSQVTTLRQNGHSYADIAGRLGLTRNQVAGMVRDLRARGQVIP